MQTHRSVGPYRGFNRLQHTMPFRRVNLTRLSGSLHSAFQPGPSRTMSGKSHSHPSPYSSPSGSTTKNTFRTACRPRVLSGNPWRRTQRSQRNVEVRAKTVRLLAFCARCALCGERKCALSGRFRVLLVGFVNVLISPISCGVCVFCRRSRQGLNRSGSDTAHRFLATCP